MNESGQETGFWQSVVEYFKEFHGWLSDVLAVDVLQIRMLDVLILVLCLVGAYLLNRIFCNKLPKWIEQIKARVVENRRRIKAKHEQRELERRSLVLQALEENKEAPAEDEQTAENEVNAEASAVSNSEASASKACESAEEADSRNTETKVLHEAVGKEDAPKEPKKQERIGINSLQLIEVLANALKKPLKYMIYTASLGLALTLMRTPDWAVGFHDIAIRIIRASMMLWFVWYVIAVTNRLTHHFAENAAKTSTKLDDMLVPLISSVVKFLVIFAGGMLVIQALGYPVHSMIASLGIGGAALALASKDTLANLFGAFVVFFDKPFEIGDWVAVNGVEGEVEEIRLRTTLIRTWDNSVVTLPNSVLSTSNIDNYEKRHYRKMECGFGVLYSTTAEQVEEIVREISRHLEEHAVKDPNDIQPNELYSPNYYVGFKGFGDSSLDIEVVAFTVKTGKKAHMADRQNFLLEIMRIVERAGTGFAFPTRTLEWAPGMMPKMGQVSKMDLETKK